MRKLILVLLAFGMAAVPVTAHNNYFLPGDAFFSVALPQVLMEKWSESKEDAFEFEYSRYDGQFFSCGNIGYTKLVVEDVTPTLRATLAEAYWRYADERPLYREMGDEEKSVLEQTNSVVALIYNGDFNLEMRLGLKYNEQWVSQGDNFYGGYFESAEAVRRDWQSAAAVPSLRVREKLEPLAHLGAGYEAHTLNAPLHVSSKDIQIILVGTAEQKGYEVTQRCPNLQAIFDQEEGAEYMVVTESLIRQFYCDENRNWVETKIELPLKVGESHVPNKVIKPGVTPGK